jgi:hypothetical protein
MQPQPLLPPPAQDLAALLQSLDQDLLLRTQTAGLAQPQQPGHQNLLPCDDDAAAAAAAAAEIEGVLHELMAPDDLDLLPQLDPEDLADALLLVEAAELPVRRVQVSGSGAWHAGSAGHNFASRWSCVKADAHLFHARCIFLADPPFAAVSLCLQASALKTPPKAAARWQRPAAALHPTCCRCQL